VTEPVLLVDGLNLYTRHFVANPSMSDLGNHVGGAVGFLRAIQYLCDIIKPKKIYVVWEGGGSPRRRAIYPGYKNSRKPPKLNRFYDGDIPDTVENRNYQLTLLIELLKYVPVCQMYISDCEADDVIGYMTRRKLINDDVIIVSSDKDYYQLISERVKQWSPGQKKFVDEDKVFDKFGVRPRNFCTVRCFVGDASDSISGVRGAGFKTIVKRFPCVAEDRDVEVQEIISLSENMLEQKIKLYKNICDSKDIVRRNWKLMYLDTQNLSATQIQKINNMANTFVPSRDKIGMLRALIREGIKTFDADRFFLSLNSSLRQDR
jgi:5'-3' exonuclease